MKRVACFLLLTIAAFGQTTTSFRAKQGILEKIWGFVKKPISTVTYTFGNGTVGAEGQATLDLYIATDRMSPAGLQWELSYDAAVVDGLTVVAGPASLAAGKGVQCATLTPTSLRCIVSGINQTLIQNGVVATVTVQTVSTATAPSTIVVLANPVTASKKGTELTSAIAPGGGVVTFPVVLVDLTCPVTEIEPNEEVECTVSLSRITAIDTIVDVLYDDEFLSGPASVIVPADHDSVTVIVVGH